MNPTTNRTRTVLDRTREPWTVEEGSVRNDGTVILRYRHELGYELAATAPSRLATLDDRRLQRILEQARRRPPHPHVADAA